jgi:hypothetical protein
MFLVFLSGEKNRSIRRATSAKAFGTLANALPEDMLGDLATSRSSSTVLSVLKPC